ncbi:MAG: 23S rRNA pseudouridine1911/1915/1917 synthase [Vicingaceae bacterium]
MADYSIGIFSNYSTKSALKKAIKKGLIFVDGLTAKTALVISGGEKIECFTENNESTKRHLNLELSLIFEDEYLAVIEKPAGILVSGNGFKTIDNALLQNLKRSNLSDACRPRPVHRLDYPTTGLLLVGKTKSAITKLNQLFENKEIKKTYLAITIGEMDAQGTIQVPVDDKKAYTHYHNISTVESTRFGKLNLLLLKPKTGRRHQLRKHLAHVGNQILGDREYGKPELLLKGKGMYLHACTLEFIHPFSEEPVSFQSRIPKRFQKIVSDDFGIERH